ncbi:MAG: hypothetical protein HYR84_03300 [Planctomycetes bacterium]|nr:hypothetical protein [Planctomycetota bacterium]
MQAGPPSAGYRLRKFVKRNRGPVTAAAIVLTTLLAGIVGTSWGWVEALWQRNDAVQARNDEAGQRKIAVKAIGDARDEALARADAEEKGRKLAERVADAEKQKLIAEQGKIEAGKRQVRLIEAHLALERGMIRCERGEIGPGLLWLARGLEVAPEDAHDLKRSLRTLLGGWSAQLHPVKAVLPVPLHLAGDVQQRRRFVSSDGKTVLINWANGAYLWDTTTDKQIGPRVYHNNMTTAA